MMVGWGKYQKRHAKSIGDEVRYRGQTYVILGQFPSRKLAERFMAGMTLSKRFWKNIKIIKVQHQRNYRKYYVYRVIGQRRNK